MSRTLTELSTLVEELEKRIKAISTTASTLAQIIAVRDAMEEVKVCFSELTKALQDEGEDASLAELQALATRVDALEASVAQLDTDSAEIQEEISSIQSSIQDINAEISQQNTSITNLQSAQTSLQATQTNLQTTLSSQASQISTLTTNLANTTNNVNSLTSRVSTCEANIGTLTNGIDLTEFEQQLNAVPQTAFSYVDLCANFLIENTQDYSRVYSYKIGDSPIVIERFKIKYTTSYTSSATIEFLRNGVVKDTIIVNLSENPNSYELNYTYYPTQELNTFQFRISCLGKIYVTGIEAFVFANNAQIFENDKDLKVECLNNYFYVTKYENESITYEKIDKTTDLKISGLANDYKNLTTRQLHVRSGIFGPNLGVNEGNAISNYDFFTREETSNKVIGSYLFPDSTKNYSSSGPILNNYATVYTFCSCIYGVSTFILNGDIHYHFGSSTQTDIFDVTNISTYLPGKFYFATACHNNNYINSQPGLVMLDKVPIIAYNQDGFLYALVGKECLGVTKIARGGQFATAYTQSDGSINVYINKGYVTYKYNLAPIEDTYTYQVTFIEKIENCDCFYEAYDGITITHTQQGWIVNQPEDTTTEDGNETETTST